MSIAALKESKKTPFRTSFAENIFRVKYAQGPNDSWGELCRRLVQDVAGKGVKTKHHFPMMSLDERDQLTNYMAQMKFIPGGRYLYYAGRELHFFNNCFMLKCIEDTRQEWSRTVANATSALMSGGGIGVDYSVIRERGRILSRTGGIASGPLSLMKMVNEVGRYVMQGGSRRSALYASLNWKHGDILDFIHVKNWPQHIVDLKAKDFNFPAPLDMTNISINWDTEFIENVQEGDVDELWELSVRQMMMTGEPGHSYNFFENENETLRNAPVSGDTHVLLRDSYRQIKDIIGLPVVVWTGKQWASTVFTRTAEMASIIRVNMTGGRSIKAEPSHPFMVERWQGKGAWRKMIGIERVEAKNLQIGDIINVEMPAAVEQPFDSTLYTLGFAYGDGSFSNNGGEITLCSDDKKALLSYFNEGMFRSTNPGDGRGHTRCYLKKEVAYSPTGRQRQKEIYPIEVQNNAHSFLAGLFDADGSWDADRKCIRLSSAHEGFLHDVRRELESMGILACVNIGSKGAYKGTPTFMLVIMSEYVSLFKHLIPTKRLKVEEHASYRCSKIKVTGLEKGDSEDVYCCNVGVPEHTFMAEGVIISNCGEVCSEDDSDVCNLGSVNMGRIESLEEFEDVCRLAAKFLVCGSVRGDLPYPKVYEVRDKNRRIGLGLMGVHEWLLRSGSKYEVTQDLDLWLKSWARCSEEGADELCDRFYLNRPVKYRSIAPTGTIGILASTTTGIEPLFAVAYKRRYLATGTQWKYEYVVDATAHQLIQEYGIKPEDIETAYGLAANPAQRVFFQAQVQRYVDHAISSTINLPAWGSELNNEDHVKPFAAMLLKYCPFLRGITTYPNGSRGGQPLEEVPYQTAIANKGVVFDEDENKCAGGICGV